MSSVKLKHASGGAVNISAPQSNPSSDRTLYLPSNADGTISTTNYVSVYEFSTWYMTSDFNPAENDVIENWAVSNAQGYEGLGTAPSYSGGTFSGFSTGYWRVTASMVYFHNTQDNDTFVIALRHSTDSGSNYNRFAAVGGRVNQGMWASTKLSWTVQGTFKVANASNSRLQVYGYGIDPNDGRFMGGSQANSQVSGSIMNIEKVSSLI